MKPRLGLGIDVGTQSVKALVLDPDAGRVLGRASEPLALDRSGGPGSAEQAPEDWVRAVSAVVPEALRRAGRRAGDVCGLAVSGQQHGLVLLDDTGQVVRPAKLWCDTSTVVEAVELSNELGRSIPAGYTASKIRWVGRHEPASLDRTRCVLLPHDYLNFRLTGRKSMECGDASGTGFFDARRRRFDERAMATIDRRLASWLPPLIAARSAAGTLSDEGARLTGLPAGLPVATGSGDNMMSAIGAGADRPGRLILSLGTSGTAFARSDVPIDDPDGAVAPFCDALGGHLPLLCVMNMTGVTQDLIRLFGVASHEEITAAALREDSGSGGLTYLAFLEGERVPDLPEATGSLHGLRVGNLTSARWYRAAIEGTSATLAAGVDRLRAQGLSIDEVRVVGGGAKNPLWCRVLATLLGQPMHRLVEPDSAALGAALQGVALGRDEPIHDLVDRCVRVETRPFDPEPSWGSGLDALRDRADELALRLYGKPLRREDPT